MLLNIKDGWSHKNWLRNRIRLRNRLASKFLTPNPALCPFLPCFYMHSMYIDSAFPKNSTPDQNLDRKVQPDSKSAPDPCPSLLNMTLYLPQKGVLTSTPWLWHWILKINDSIHSRDYWYIFVKAYSNAVARELF